MNEVTISKSHYDYLVTQANRMKFLQHYKPTIHEDGEPGTYEMVVGENGLIDTVRYGTMTDCIDNSIKDLRDLQKVFWVGEETEIYAGGSIELILLEFFNGDEREEILKENLYGEVDLTQEVCVKDEETGIKTIMTINQLFNETVVFPNLLSTSYN
ncbi:MAG: hypothetical protein SPE06_05450 [[Actinobacillus] rossii]|nr:hypothetical protein [[Actinobacillus] rossii]MDY4505837.1 hypothetical protein [[Actinobacillus] rossii]